MPVLADSKAATIAPSVSDIFNQELKLDQNQALKVASIIGHDPNFNRKPDYWINIFNISPVEHIRHRPVDFPTIRIAACPPGKPYICAVRVPNIINYKWVSAETGQPSFVAIKGERFATDLINPGNITDEMWRDSYNPDMDQMHGGGDDLSRRGVFWSKNDVPTPEELKMAKTRMEKHYRECVQKAEDLARQGKTGEIGGEAHIAADYLRVNSTWHVRTAVQEPCPNCGEMINPGIAFHASAFGSLCVLDWKRAVSAGVKAKADVPDEARWWAKEDDRPRK